MNRNIARLSKTYQDVANAWSAMRATSCVSRCSQIMPNTEIIGNDAIIVPVAGFRRAVSETVAIKMANKTVLMTR